MSRGRLFRRTAWIGVQSAILTGALLFCQLESVAAEDLESRVAAINAEVEKESRELKEISTKLTSLKSTERGYKSRVEKVKTQISMIESELRSLKQERAALEESLLRQEGQIKAVRAAALRRIRALYTQRTASILERLLLGKGGSELSRSAYYLAKVKEYDRRLMEEISRLSAAMDQEKARLDVVLSEQKALKHDLFEEERQLGELISKQRPLMMQLQTAAKQKEQTLAFLKLQAGALEKVLASLTSGKTDKPINAVSDEQSRAVTREPETSPKVQPSAVGLAGDLVFPVRGKVIKNFGKYRVDEFADYVFSKGVEISTPQDSEVRVVAGGQAMYVGRMPGYGLIVIVDHGRREYSLYGCLGEVLVAVGDALESGAVVAKTGAPDKHGRSFYFEIRKNGAPVDPQSYFTRPLAQLAG
ncbi:MAG: peptidoglycan DD-metalloendopeptidase family protein [Deltaproteobacteria bacterium]|nr:peptidoglycan DD-metalloendopeptidase family protein [Deltaproteobacteria bacterium]